MNEHSPSLNGKPFKCPHCKVVAKHSYFAMIASEIDITRKTEYSGGHMSLIKHYALTGPMVSACHVSECDACDKLTLWFGDEIIYPENVMTIEPNQDLDDDIKELFNEARSIVSKSPKGAAALLRLCLQKLCIQLGQKGNNINEDIAKMVKDGALPTKIQQALDIVRVVGNNAVHPGKIDFNDNTDIAVALFSLINIIADTTISEPKKIDELFNKNIPESAKKAIERRDGKK